MARSLSDYWRIDKSRDRTQELASILDGAAKTIELLNVGCEVEWAKPLTISYTKSLTGLDSGILNGFTAPVPGQVVDVAIGIAIHKIGHEKWTEPITNYANWSNLSWHEKKELNDVYHILEDAYICSRLGRISNTLSEYTRAVRKAIYPEGSKQAIGLLAKALARDNLIEIWTAVSLHSEHIPNNAPKEVTGALTFLIQKTINYSEVDKHNRRLVMAVDVWQWLQQFPRGDTSQIIDQVILEIGSQASDERNGIEKKNNDQLFDQLRRNIYGGNQSGSLKDLSHYLDNPTKTYLCEDKIKKREESAHSQVEDLTCQLSQMGIADSVTRIKNASYDALAYNSVKAMVSKEIQQIRRIFSQFDILESRWRHGLEDGKLDGRRLYRVGVGKTTVFKLRDMPDNPSLAVVLLLDVSASMGSYLLDVNKTACIFSEALSPLYPKVWYEVVTYTASGLQSGSDVQLSRLASSKMKLSLKDVWMDGGTPSGEAIASALLLLKGRTAHRKVIIHFTDGRPKDERTVRQALGHCRKDKVDVIIISVEVKQDDIYGEDKGVVIHKVPDLPGAMMGLLQKIYR
ncbi:vWA domain-containing protein [Chloroflexota bacterium]